MLSWKEKVAGKISRLLADSPSSPPSHFAKDSPIVRPETEAMPLTSEVLCGPETSSYSSYLFSLLPSVSCSFNGSKSEKLTAQHDVTSSPLRLLPSKRKSKSFVGKDRPLDCSADCGLDRERSETMMKLGVDIGHVSQKIISASTKCEEAPTSLNSVKFLPDLMDESSFISSTLFEFLQSSLPNIVKGCQWMLLYSTLKHGISLRTLLRKSVDLPGPCLLIVGDMQGAVFGGLLECPLKPTPKRKYQGTNQTFVFTTIYGAPRLFRATGANRYYYLCLNDLLALGGGGSFALCLDGDLLHGTSGPCETFGNFCLAHNQEFELKNVELWGFTHSMGYLS